MKLHSRIYGEGKPMLILHGLFGMSDNWNTLGKQWADECRVQVHLIDLRNHGRSDWATPHTYGEMSTDLEEYLQKHNLTEVYVLGHSMGGKAAMFFATLFPDVVKKLIVADIAPRQYEVHHQQILDALDFVRRKKPKGRSEAEDFLAEKISHRGIQMFLLKSLHKNKEGWYDWRFNFEQIYNDIEEVGIALPAPAIYTGPTLFIRGSESNYINDDDFDIIEQHFPGAQIKTIQNAGHWLHAEQPEIFSELTTSFLKIK